MDYWNALSLFILIFILARSKSATSYSLSKRELRCPIYSSIDWKARDTQCINPNGTAYHCIEDGNNAIVIQGCYEVKKCQKGAHPALVEGDFICQKCENGFQPVESKPSDTFSLSYCEKHRPVCNPEYGQSECRAATADSDRGCMCNSTLGFELNYRDIASCECFSKNNYCPCVFIGCPSGFVRNEKGFCEPDIRTTTASLNTSQVSATDGPSSGKYIEYILIIVFSILGGLVAVGLSLILFLCWRRKQKRKQISESNAVTKTNESSADKQATEFTADKHANELTAEGQANGLKEVESRINQPIFINVKHVGKMEIQSSQQILAHVKNAGFLGIGEVDINETEAEVESERNDADRTAEAAGGLAGEEMKATAEVIPPSTQDSAACRPSQEEQPGFESLALANPTESQRMRENYQPTPDVNDEAVHPEPSAPDESLPVATAPYLSLPFEDKGIESDDSETQVKQPRDTRAVPEESETSVQHEDRRDEMEEDETLLKTPHPTARSVAGNQQTDLQEDEENAVQEESPLLGGQNTSQAAMNRDAGGNNHTAQTINADSLKKKKSERKANDKAKSKAENKKSVPQLAYA